MVKKAQFLSLALATAGFLMLPSLAQAGGFGGSHHGKMGGAAYAKALANSYTKLNSKRVKLRTSSYANITTKNLYNQIIEGKGVAGNQTYITVDGKKCNGHCRTSSGNNVYVHNTSSARTKVYAKGKTILIKARAKNYTNVKVNGLLHLENENTAIAVSRFSPVLSMAYSRALNTTTVVSTGGVHLQNGNVAQVNIRR